MDSLLINVRGRKSAEENFLASSSSLKSPYAMARRHCGAGWHVVQMVAEVPRNQIVAPSMNVRSAFAKCLQPDLGSFGPLL